MSTSLIRNFAIANRLRISIINRNTVPSVHYRSVLGPAQFVMYTEDLGELITDFSVLPLFFADDTHYSQLLTSTTPSGVADVCRRLERCVTAVHGWCTQSWAWVHFAKSKPTQSTSWLTQSNSIHNDHVYSDPHDIQSNQLYPAVAKH